jgi:hypothetical protein
VKIYRKWERFPEGGLLTVWMETLNVIKPFIANRLEIQSKSLVHPEEWITKEKVL